MHHWDSCLLHLHYCSTTQNLTSIPRFWVFHCSIISSGPGPCWAPPPCSWFFLTAWTTSSTRRSIRAAWENEETKLSTSSRSKSHAPQWQFSKFGSSHWRIRKDHTPSCPWSSLYLHSHPTNVHHWRVWPMMIRQWKQDMSHQREVH